MMERITEVPLMAIQITENFPEAGGKYLGLFIYRKTWFSRMTPNTSHFINILILFYHENLQAKPKCHFFSCHSTLILTQYWVSWGTPFKKSISSISLPFYYGVNCLTEGHIRFVGKFIEKQNSLQTETGLVHSLQLFTPCSVKKLQIVSIIGFLGSTAGK